MKNPLITPVVIGAVLALLVLSSSGRFDTARANPVVARPAPEFTQDDPQAWLGSEPLSIHDLRGNVVLIDFWTFGCWNCYRSFPWLNALEEKYADREFRVIGIHSPEFAHEKKRASVAAKIKEFKLAHPSMMDNDFAYWRRMGNRYWPTFYLIDKRGYVRYSFIGETHADTLKAREIESAVEQLLKEST